MSGRLSWRAIAFGIAPPVAVSVVMLLAGGALGWVAEAFGPAVLGWLVRLLALGADAAGGFIAGRTAGRDGALHGLVSGAIAAVIGLAISVPQFLLLGFSPDAGYWVQVAVWSLAGVALSFVGGALGAQSRRA